jgi:hypothetical protein
VFYKKKRAERREEGEKGIRQGCHLAQRSYAVIIPQRKLIECEWENSVDVMIKMMTWFHITCKKGCTRVDQKEGKQ